MPQGLRDLADGLRDRLSRLRGPIRAAVPAPGLRVLLAAVTVLAGLQLALAVAAFLAAAQDAEGRFRLPLPGRVAAMVEVVEATPPPLRETLLEAMRARDFAVAIMPALPEDDDRERYPLERVARLLDRYVDALGRRRVEAWLAPLDESEPSLGFEATRLWSSAPMRLGVSLDDGQWLMIETRDRLAARVFGFPPGLWAGLLGVLVALAALATLWRGLGPLTRLAAHVDRFGRGEGGRDLVAEPIPERGAREVAHVTRAVNAMEERIAELMRERGVAFAAMSHDLRTYLARLALRVEGIADERSRAKARGEIEEMGRLVEDSLALVRLDGPRGEADATLDLAALAAEVAAAHGLPFPEDEDRAPVRGDRALLRRALENLVANAERHGGGAEVAVAADAARVAVEVRDRGPGIEAGERERVMRPFERGDRARTLDVPGSGLGLAIAARVALAHRGRLDLRERPGGGLVAALALPRAPADADVQAPDRVPDRVPGQAPGQGSGTSTV